MKQIRNKQGFGFVEIIIAIIIAAVSAVPIFYLVTSSRVETSKAINYLRALELANEGFEWASITHYNDKTTNNISAINQKVQEFCGSLYGNNEIRTGTNGLWNLVENKIPYSEQYNNAFFYRTIAIDSVGTAYGGYLRKITVTVSWAEEKKPPVPTQPGGRSRFISLSGLLFNEDKLQY